MGKYFVRIGWASQNGCMQLMVWMFQEQDGLALEVDDARTMNLIAFQTVILPTQYDSKDHIASRAHERILIPELLHGFQTFLACNF